MTANLQLNSVSAPAGGGGREAAGGGAAGVLRHGAAEENAVEQIEVASMRSPAEEDCSTEAAKSPLTATPPAEFDAANAAAMRSCIAEMLAQPRRNLVAA